MSMLIETAKLFNGQLAVYYDCVVISRKGIMPLFYQSYLRGEKTIPMTSITAIQLKKQGMKQGFIHFSVQGEGKLARSYEEMVRDENTITFIPADQKKVIRLKEIIEDLMYKAKEAATAASANVFVQPATIESSPVDELIKLKQLLDSGVISNEEFETMKKSLIKKM